jgi:hypothetical protein
VLLSSPFFLNQGEWWLIPTPIMAENGDVFSPKTKGTRRRQSLSLDMVTTTNRGSALPTLRATLPLPAIYRDPANQYDICDVRGKMCF